MRINIAQVYPMLAWPYMIEALRKDRACENRWQHGAQPNLYRCDLKLKTGQRHIAELFADVDGLMMPAGARAGSRRLIEDRHTLLI